MQVSEKTRDRTASFSCESDVEILANMPLTRRRVPVPFLPLLSICAGYTPSFSESGLNRHAVIFVNIMFGGGWQPGRR